VTIGMQQKMLLDSVLNEGKLVVEFTHGLSGQNICVRTHVSIVDQVLVVYFVSQLSFQYNKDE